MKDYFIQLANYDQYANLLISELIIKAENPEKPVKIMGHLLTAQQIWISRMRGLPLTGVTLWADWNAETFEHTIKDNHRALVNFLDYADPDDFDKVINYKTLNGDPYQNKLKDILTHVINHGTHHRAQIGQLLKLEGAELPNTDFIFYLRS
ncbi:MAG: DinB family protein [Mucilaginibacter sp.]